MKATNYGYRFGSGQGHGDGHGHGHCDGNVTGKGRNLISLLWWCQATGGMAKAKDKPWFAS